MNEQQVRLHHCGYFSVDAGSKRPCVFFHCGFIVSLLFYGRSDCVTVHE